VVVDLTRAAVVLDGSTITDIEAARVPIENWGYA